VAKATKILITGGAGFIGCHLATELLERNYDVRVLDGLAVQVHGDSGPANLAREAEFMRGDVCDAEAVAKALKGVDAVFHLAAAVGVGQRMYEIAYYTRSNNLGSAVLCEAISRNRIGRLIVASSMSVYGEGLYQTADGATHASAERTIEQLKAHQWEPRDESGAALMAIPTPETKPPCLASIYALSKFDQERMCLLMGKAYGIPTVALRFFNVYGPRQALSNPYTGVLTNFAARLLNDNQPLVFEDGMQKRDFVSVYDVARACRLALETPTAAGNVFNVGTGQPQTIIDLAARMAHVLGRRYIEPLILGQYRAGDIRHCFADIQFARTKLHYQPRVTIDDGIDDLAAWLETQRGDDRALAASAELAMRGLVI
jgi:dTDP-L-rhamnose 4-epimerase